MESVQDAFCSPQPVPQLTLQEDSPGVLLEGHPKQHLCFPGLGHLCVCVSQGAQPIQVQFSWPEISILGGKVPSAGDRKGHISCYRLLSSSPVGLSPSHSGRIPAHKGPFSGLLLPYLSCWPLSVLR